MATLISTVGTAGFGAAALFLGLLWWLYVDGPARLCAGLVAVFHPKPDRRKAALAVLESTRGLRRRGRGQ
ncbi:hypothetical protein [Nocardia yamanashiensis]|uniref:hypothetical protein n=1 Tax=Nocardia yamanashiensis TaxID=209247 RepID=UPI000ACB2D98|nr:hypothetical protein [Nocardia yamanashiensis]